MKYCKNCNLKFDGNQNNCFFCKGKLEPSDDQISSSFPAIKATHYYIHLARKIVAFSLLALIAISIMLEIYLFNDRAYWLLVTFSSIYAFLVVCISTNLTLCAVGKILDIAFLTSIECIGVFAFFEIGLKEICLTYIYPGIIIVAFIAMLLIYLINKRRNIHDQLIYLFLNIIWGLTPILFLATKLVSPTFPSSICIAIFVLTAIGFLFFSIKDSKEEMKRRFHV